jgi:hypothetical protein
MCTIFLTHHHLPLTEYQLSQTWTGEAPDDTVIDSLLFSLQEENLVMYRQGVIYQI